MPRYKKYLVPLLAVLALLLLPLGASARSAGCAEIPCFGGSLQGYNPRPEPGSVMRVIYQAGGLKVSAVTVTLTLPSEMLMIKRGSKPYVLVGGKPTWTMHNINSSTELKSFKFYTKVRATVRRGSVLHVAIREVARAGTWKQDLKYGFVVHIPMH